MAERRIVDGHGDLLADDIFCLPDGPRILDCLEFDDRLRYVDRIDDIAFLAMDLERLGAPELTARLLGWYREYSADPPRPRWCTTTSPTARSSARRCAACAPSRAIRTPAREAHALVGIARRHLGAGAVRLVLVGGLPGTGKSTLSGRIADELGYVVLSSDRIRKELAGLIPRARPGAYREGLYSPGRTRPRCTPSCSTGPSCLLGRGESVVLDASWSSRAASARPRPRSPRAPTAGSPRSAARSPRTSPPRGWPGAAIPPTPTARSRGRCALTSDPGPRRTASTPRRARSSRRARRSTSSIPPARAGRGSARPGVPGPRTGGHRLAAARGCPSAPSRLSTRSPPTAPSSTCAR